MRIITIFILIFLASCKNSLLPSDIVNPTTKNKKKNQDEKLCLISNAINYKKQLPCKCSKDQSLINGSCVDSNIFRSCYKENAMEAYQYSQDFGQVYSNCIVSKCIEGFSLINNECVKTSQEKMCIIENATKAIQVSDNGGQSFGQCTVKECNNGYTLIKNQCIKTYQEKMCIIENATKAIQVSDNGGQSFSQCTVIECNLNSKLINNSCVLISQKRSCINRPLNSIGGYESTNNAGIEWSKCQEFSCNSGYLMINQQCLLANVSKTCNKENAKSAYMYSINAGQVFGECQINECNNGYILINNQCIKTYQEKECLIENSVKSVQVSNNGGQSFGQCNVVQCLNDYTLLNNKCLKTYQEKECSITNGIGFQETFNGSQTWSTCQVKECNNGYTKINNSCITSNQQRACLNQPSNSIGGFEYTNDAWINKTSCQNFTCKEGFFLDQKTNTCLDSKKIVALSFNPYLSKFMQLAQDRSKDIQRTIQIKFENSLSGTNVIGTCVYSVDRVININPTWWNNTNISNSEREYALFHELGHCLLDRGHKTALKAFEDNSNVYAPASMMYPSIMSNYIYNNNLNYYYNELFDSTYDTQNHSIYYNSKSQFDNNYYANAIVAPITVNVTNFIEKDGKIICADEEFSL